MRRAGVGAVGMCFTGRYALAMAVEPAVLAPVLSQPGIPAPVTARKRAALGLDPADLASVKARTSDGLCVLGLRFSQDRGSPAERFATLRAELGENFEAIEIDSSPGNPHGIRKERALGAHRGTGGRVRSYDSGRAGPGDGLPRRTAAVVTGRPTRRPRPASRR